MLCGGIVSERSARRIFSGVVAGRGLVFCITLTAVVSFDAPT